jgi:stage IV sporulation protein B
LKLSIGNAFDTKVAAVRKGKAGEPGQLMGCAESREPIGMLTKNLPQGVFGVSENGWNGKMMEVASWDQIKTGSATILSTVSGNAVQQYSVEILKIYPKSGQSGRNLLIKVTDPALIETTGGIVQGMSGSPIIQDGKLIGAVTHVLVNDPTRGYGIFIENMLEAAS